MERGFLSLTTLALRGKILIYKNDDSRPEFRPAFHTAFPG
jgi:hypothetical protein